MLLLLHLQDLLVDAQAWVITALAVGHQQHNRLWDETFDLRTGIVVFISPAFLQRLEGFNLPQIIEG